MIENNKTTIKLSNHSLKECAKSLLLIFSSVFFIQFESVADETVDTDILNSLNSGNSVNCIGNLTNPTTLDLPMGKSTLIKLPEALSSRTVGNPSILQAKLISPETLYLIGIDIGNTNMIVQGVSGSCTIIDVNVKMDPQGLQDALEKLLPSEKNISVSSAADSLVLSGSVEDPTTLNNVINIANAFVRRKLNPVDLSSNSTNSGMSSNNNMLNNNSQQMSSPRIVNMLSVSAQQQVMLEVKIAEVSKTLLDQFGANANFGGDSFKILSNFFSTSTASVGAVTSGPIIGSTTGKGITIDAQMKDSLVKVLAEPTIMAISGQEGSFLAGGKIFIPVPQASGNGAPTITLVEKEYGVGLKFLPTVLSGGRINMKVSPEVSQLDNDGIAISAPGASGSTILPSFTTRRASTTVQLMDGQTFAIGGLINNNTTANIRGLPVLGQIPILGALFRSTDFQKDRTELVFIVTPHLVKPLNTNDYKLPTDNISDPSRVDLFLNGKLESNESVIDQKIEIDETNTSNNTGFDVK